MYFRFPGRRRRRNGRGESGGGGYDPFRDFLHFTLLLQHFRRLKIRYLARARVLDFVTPSSRQPTEKEGFFHTVPFLFRPLSFLTSDPPRLMLGEGIWRNHHPSGSRSLEINNDAPPSVAEAKALRNIFSQFLSLLPHTFCRMRGEQE